MSVQRRWDIVCSEEVGHCVFREGGTLSVQRRWDNVCSTPQSHLVYCVSSMYCHLLMLVSARPTPGRSRLSGHHQSHGWSDPAGWDSVGCNPIFMTVDVFLQSCFPHFQSGVVGR